MKKPSRRSKRSSVAEATSPVIDQKGKQESQMKSFYEKRVSDLEIENQALKREIGQLSDKLNNIQSPPADRKPKQVDPVTELKKKLSSQSKYSAQKQKNSEGREDEIQILKVQRVQLLCKIKLESVQFRLAKASLEKEVLQLKKEQRRNAYEMRKLLTLNERQKLVLQRKTEEASMATKRLNELLESRKASSLRTSGSKTGSSPGIQNTMLEIKFRERVEENERQMEEMADELRKFEEEAEILREENYGFLLRDKEADCAVRDSELRDLKEEVVQLSKMVNQLGKPKTQVRAISHKVDPVQSSVSSGSSVEFLDIDASETEHSGANIAPIGKSRSGACCSCSKKSLCKTSKCECKASQGSCGSRCGCAASKCTNRETPIKVDNSMHPKQPQPFVPVSGNLGAKDDVVTSQPAELNNDCQPRRKPLLEVGNILKISSPMKPGHKTRRQNAVAQLDTVHPSLLLPENARDQGKAGKPAATDITVKLTRRSQVSDNIS